MERLDGDAGAKVELNEVLLVVDGEKIAVGNPVLEGAKIQATIVEQGKDKKVIVFKYKSKVRYSRKRGHRQLHTRLAINQIVSN